MNRFAIGLLAVWTGVGVMSEAQAQKAATSVEEVMAPVDAAEDETPVSDGDTERDSRKGLGIGLRAGTLGFGVEGIYSLSKYFNVRAQGNFFNYETEVDEDDVSYDGELDFKTLGLLVDWHPFKGSFRVTGGVYKNDNRIDLNATCPNEGCEVGDLTITTTGNQDGRITGAVNFKSTSPYAGFGWGNAMKGWPVHFAFDIGVLFQGAPQFNLAATGTATVRDDTQPTGPNNPQQVNLATNQEVQRSLAEEEQTAQEEANEYELYPVITLTIGYRFSF